MAYYFTFMLKTHNTESNPQYRERKFYFLFFFNVRKSIIPEEKAICTLLSSVSNPQRDAVYVRAL